MEVRVFDTYGEMCGEVAGEIQCVLRENPEALLCIAAGHTSLGLFGRLAEMHGTGDVDFSRASFVAMDEWLGMSETTPNGCGSFLRENFLNKVNFRPGNVRLFDGAANDPERECSEVERFIETKSKNRAIDYLVLGTGMNGHLALNEPGCDLSARARVTGIDAVTKRVGQKYFAKETELSGGLTLGVDNFSEAGRSVLMVSGPHKRDTLHRILAGPVSNELPATALKTFKNAGIYCDREAYGD